MEGTLVVQTGWDYEDEEVEEMMETVVIDPESGEEMIIMAKQKVTKVKKNQPTAVVCRNEDIYIDPTCMDNMDKCQFVIHRYETDLSSLRADGRYKNLDQVEKHEGQVRDNGYYPQDHTYFTFEDKARKKMVMYEYWGNYDVNEDGIAEPIVCSWIGNTVVRLQSNPYPDKKPPFIVVPFNAVPFQIYGDSLASVIGDNQKVKTAIIRGVIDNMAQSNNGQVGMKKGSLDIANRKKFLQGNNFEYNGDKGDFWQGSYNQIPGSAFDVMTLMNNEIESQTGVKSFSGGITGNALGSSATGARGALDATATRRISLVRNIAENLIKPLMRKWMSYNAEFLEAEEIVRITNEEFIPIKRDDLTGNIDIDISISTAEDNNAKSQELSFLLQTLGNTMPFEMTQMIIAEIAKLSRMPDLEKRIRDFKQEPDPAAQQMQQAEMERLALENQKLQSEIARNNARAGEDEIDIQLKMQKAQVEAAKARKLGSEADMTDLDFLLKNDGIDRADKATEREEKRLHDLDKIALSNMLQPKKENK